jgi:GNAT superfamily N-acetyltransferase
MDQIVETRDTLGHGLVTRSTVEPLDGSLIALHQPCAHFLFLRDSVLAGRCSIWADNTPKIQGEPVGLIGHYAASDGIAGVALLTHACQQLAQRGLRTVVGPMDGSTWRRYRLLTQRGTEPVFFMEPDNPDHWPNHFAAAGFSSLARYTSAINSDLSVVDPRVPEAWRRAQSASVTIRPINPTAFDQELTAIRELSIEAFADNFLYTPISAAEFLAMYKPILPHLRPELILFAERDEQLIGFVFGMPDILQSRRGIPIDTAILKTIAVRPGRTGAGLGSILIDRAQQAAHKLGFTRVIHALMHEANRSTKISRRFGRPMRQYTLYGKRVSQ